MQGGVGCGAAELGGAVAGKGIGGETGVVKQKVARRDGGLRVLSKFRTQKIGVSQGHVQVEQTALIKLAASLSGAFEKRNEKRFKKWNEWRKEARLHGSRGARRDLGQRRDVELGVESHLHGVRLMLQGLRGGAAGSTGGDDWS